MILRQRLANQGIGIARFDTPADVVRWLGAVQAQDFNGALWTVGLRARVATVGDVLQALQDRTIVRTWPMRGTLHFVAATDVRWMLALLSPRTLAAAARRHAELELDNAVLQRSRQALIKALPSTRDGALNALQLAGVPTDEHRVYHILWRLAQEGLICFGPVQGRQQTFVLLDEWVPPAPAMDREAALAELARRYFTSHGPATLADFTWWTGLKAADARLALHLVSSELTSIDSYWTGPASKPGGPTVHLLPGFDEYLLGYTDRSAMVDVRYAKRLTPGGGMFAPTVIVRGHVEGTWRKVVKKNSVHITIDPFDAVPDASAAAARYGRFLGLEVEP